MIKQVNGFRLEVDWRIDNELAVLFGYSGAGKSLTLQLIAGLLQPDSGKISANVQVFLMARNGLMCLRSGGPSGMCFKLWPSFRI